MLFLLLACQSKPAIKPYSEASGRRPDVVVVTLDTTRADRLGAYGYRPAKTDTIDSLARAGIRFDQAYSPLPLTIPSHSTMFTGLLPHRHHIRSNGDNVLGKEFNTLAEQLKASGYSTAASVAAFVTGRDWGFNQGFDVYFDTLPEDQERNFWHTERNGALVVDDALGWLQKQPSDKPVFLWVHLYDAHYPYNAPAQYQIGNPEPYDAELAFIDDQIARLVQSMQDRPVLWALIGDHGESLGEHNEQTHGNLVYNATQHIPWILSGAGISPGVVTEPVSSADLTPTLLSALSLPIPENLDGKPQPGTTQVPYAESFQLTERFHLSPQQMVVSGRLKLVANPRPELYDVVADPGEKVDLAEKKPEDVARMLNLLKEKAVTLPGKSNQNLDPETLARLAALGYVAEGSWSGEDPFSLPDPKDFRDVFEGLLRLERGEIGSPEDILKLLASYTSRLPRSFELKNRQVTLLQRLKRPEEARLLMDEMARQFPDQPRIFITLAQSSLNQGELAEALLFIQQALLIDPINTSAQEVHLQLLERLNRKEEAITAGLDYMKQNPLNYGVAAQLGRLYLMRNQLPDAERFLRVAVSATNPKRNARVQLAILARLAKVRTDAYLLLSDEIKEYPGNLMARRLLATMYGEEQRWTEQAEILESIAKLQPKEVSAQVAWAQALFNIPDYKASRNIIDTLLPIYPDEPDVLLLHANLLAKEGKREEGYEVFKRADALNTARSQSSGLLAPE